MNEKDLFKLKEQIDQTRTRLGELRGRRDYLMEQLHKLSGHDSLEQALARIKELNERVKRLDEEIQERILRIEVKIHKRQEKTTHSTCA